MKISSLTIFFVIFFVLFSIISFAAKSFNVGVSPGILNLGDLKLDSTKLVDFYITTPSEETILVKLEPEKGNLDFFNKPDYKNLIYNYSEEDATFWVKVINNPVEIKPSNETLKTLGGVIKGREQISFLIDVPKDAEPGYHLFYIKPIPSIPSESIGAVGGRVVAVTAVGVLLNIPGYALRKGTILDIETGNYVGNSLELKTYFQNTGTITISASAIQRIYDENGEIIKELYSGKTYVKPKEIKTFLTFLPTAGLSLKDYNVFTIVEYTTDKAEKSSVIKLISPPPTALAAKREEVLLIPLLIIISIFVVFIIIYRRIR